MKENEKPWKSYFLYMSDPLRFAPEDQLNWILASDEISPVIDRYRTLIRVCQNICISGYSNVYNHTLAAISQLDGIHDISLNKILFAINPVSALQSCNFDRTHIKCLDEYTSGLYESALSNALAEIRINPLFFGMYEIAAKSIVYGQIKTIPTGESLSDQALKLMVAILRRDETSSGSYQDFLKIAATSPCAAWSNQALTFALCEHSTEHEKNILNNRLPGELSNQTFSPRSCRIIHKPLREIVGAETERQLSDSTSAIIHSLSIGNLDKEKSIEGFVPEYRRLKHRALGLMVHGQFSDATSCFERILSDATPGAIQGALVGAIECLLKISDLGKCCELVTKWCLKNQVFAHRIPLDKIAKSIEDKRDRNIVGNLNYPIFFDILVKSRGLQKYDFRYESYDDFMDSMNIERPSQLSSISDILPKAELVYFLRECCDRSVLELSRHIKSSHEVELERMAICQALIGLDPENGSLYSGEIKDISHKLLVNRGTQVFDQSKIFVNTDGIRKKTQRDMREIFGRYIDFIASPEGDPSKQILVIRLSGTSGKHADVHIATNEKAAIFSDIFLALREDFIASNEYGLDSYLSVRIRHGTLAGQLRRPFELLHLITQRDARNVYGDNEYWRLKIRTSTDNVKLIMKSMSAFSAKIDTEITRVKNRLIQIKTETEERNPDGLFDYSYSHIDLVNLEIDFRSTKSIDEEDIYKFCFTELWKKTEDGLHSIREFIRKDLREYFIKSLDFLSEEISTIAEPNQDNGIDQLVSAIKNSKIDVQKSLGTVERWFTRRDSATSQECSIQEIFSIAITTINNVNPNSPITPKFTIHGDSKIAGSHVTHMVAIFYILLENIIKRSGYYGNIPDVNIEISESVSNVTITVTNKITPEIAADPEYMARINEAKQIAAGRSSEGLVKKEGGSGFSKIRKLFKTDLGRDHIDMSISINELSFSISISFDPRGLLA
jgi:hypothetical protein